MTEPRFWKIPLAQLFEQLDTSAEGLSEQQVLQTQGRHGPNLAVASTLAPAWLRLARRFANPLVVILLLASAISAMAGDVASLAVVFCILAISILLDFSQEARALTAIEALRAGYRCEHSCNATEKSASCRYRNCCLAMLFTSEPATLSQPMASSWPAAACS